MAASVLCTRRDFERARTTVLRLFQEQGVVTRRQLSSFRMFGLPYDSIELAVRDLISKGAIEELYVLPSPHKRNGQRPVWLALSAALDTKAVTLPPGVVRFSKALELIADEIGEAV